MAHHYGYFMINENMIFFNCLQDLFVWINPDLLENHVKIYLPPSPEGELSMVRSILSYLKIWLKCDFNLISDAKRLADLLARL